MQDKFLLVLGFFEQLFCTEIKIDSDLLVYLIIHFFPLTQIVPPLHLTNHWITKPTIYVAAFPFISK